MKYTTQLILTFATSFVFLQLLGFTGVSPLWVIALLPIFGLVQINVASRYNFRQSLEFKDVPERGYENRLSELNQAQNQARSLGFIKFDECYLPVSPDCVMFIYQHETEPVTMYDCHLGQARLQGFETRFENNVRFETSNAQNSGLIPRPDEQLLQSFLAVPLDCLFEQHLRGVAFLRDERGLEPQTPLIYGFRRYFIEGYMKLAPQAKSILWGVKCFYWMATNRAGQHAKPIREQFLAGTTKILAR